MSAVLGGVGGGRLSPGGASSLAGSQGSDATLPFIENNGVTIKGRGDFAAMNFTISQTKDLTNQAISVSWTGGPPTYTQKPSDGFNRAYYGNYVQIFQCWGDDDGEFTDNPGPSPTHCEYGGESDNPRKAYPIDDQSSSHTYSRVIGLPETSCGTGAPAGCKSFDDLKQLAHDHPDQAYWDPDTNYVYSPFQGVDGGTANRIVDYTAIGSDPPRPFDISQYFDHNSTNEINYSRTFGDGTGQDLFQVLTGVESNALGCGQKSQPAGSSLVIPKCWLVIVPRGTAAQENPTSDANLAVDLSPLAPSAWRNRISVPLTFNPIGDSCAIGATTRRISGSELAQTAVGSWQPALCQLPGAPPYNYTTMSDDLAQGPLATSDQLAVTSEPVPGEPDPDDPVVYAPLTVSGVTVAMNIQRVPALTPDGTRYVPEELEIAGKRVTQINLTPRLVAKLLTQSYRGVFYPSPPKTDDYAWVQANPVTLVLDPDFVQYNPEFAELSSLQRIGASTLVVGQGSSEAYRTLWRWILADPEAVKWLKGQPDEHGMKVNPFYRADADGNPTHTPFGDPAPDNVPKSDPYCWHLPTDGSFKVGNPPAQADDPCILTWSPYKDNMTTAAAAGRSADNGGATTFDSTAAEPSAAWKKDGPQATGAQWLMAVTDTPSAARYGLQAARLSRAGDDGTARQFVAPDANGLSAGVQAMSGDGLLTPKPDSTVSGAYPLTMVTYAEVRPVSLAPDARADYARFVRFAATDGQKAGTAFGTLPPGYLPLPTALSTQALKVAADIADPSSLVTTTTTTTSTTTSTTVPSPSSLTTEPPGSSTASSSGVPSSRGNGRSRRGGSGSPTSGAGLDDTTASPAQPVLASTPTATPELSARPGKAARLSAGFVRFAWPLGILFGLVAAAAAEALGGYARPLRRLWTR